MKKKQKPLKVKLTYKQVPAEGSDQQNVDRAFDVLFDEILKRRGKRAPLGDPR